MVLHRSFHFRHRASPHLPKELRHRRPSSQDHIPYAPVKARRLEAQNAFR
jgi:hypothetical protein